MDLNARFLGFTATLAALAVAGLAAAECAPALTWATRYSGPGGGTDLAYGTAINPANGDVYVVGSEYVSPAQGNNWRIRRYNSAGTLQNTASYDGALSGDDVCTYVAVDQAGGVIVSGFQEVAGQGINWLVRKYSESGRVE